MSNQLSLGDFAPPLLPELDQYHTPMKLAHRMVEWAGIKPGMWVLEPSAGGGNLVRAILAAGASPFVMEIDPRWCKVLNNEMANCRMDAVPLLAIQADFLDHTGGPEFDRPLTMAVMNPPLTNGVGPKHVAMALKWAPKVISVLQARDLHGVERYDELWSKCDLAREAKLVRRAKWAGAGGQIETVVVDVRRKGTYDGPQTIEHWVDSWS